MARQAYFEKDEVKLVIQNLPEYLRDFVWFAFPRNVGKGEVADLLWSDVDLLGMLMRLFPENSKNGTGRLLVLEGELAGIIE
jgi:hypothetical protein